MTPLEALDSQAARRLTVRHVEGEGWVAHLPEGPRVRVPPAATPIAAIETAAAHLAQREGEAEERRAKRVLEEMQRGRYIHRTRVVQQAVDSVVVFDIHRADGTATTIRGRPAVAVAWRDLITALTSGDSP